MIISEKFFESVCRSEPGHYQDNFIFSLTLTLLFVVPVFYALGQITGNSMFYGIKDLFFVTMLAFLILMRFSYTLVYSILILAIINVYGLSLVSESYILYLFSLREFFFYPIFGIFLGYFLFKRKGSVPIFEVAIVYMIITYLYIVIFPNVSFGSTNRLHSLWDREHEPAIVGSIVFLGALFLLKRSYLKFLIIFMALGLVFLSGSRSAFVGIAVAILFVNLKNLSIRNIFIVIFLGFICFYFFDYLTFSNRSIDHNFIARLNQYSLAFDSIIDTRFLGLGTDKYGVIVGLVNQQYCLNGHCTTTMDSSLIKYIVNYGFIFALAFIAFLTIFFHVFFFKKRSPQIDFISSLIIFSLIIGMFTGKLGAFPMNLFFYMSVGSIIYLFSLKKTTLMKKIRPFVIPCGT